MLVLIAWISWSGAALAQTANHPTYPCFKHHGRFSTQNGIAEVIWLIGTDRRVGVVEELPRELAQLEPYMAMDSDQHSYIYGDFTICPVTPALPGHMRSARVKAAEKLVVQNLKGLWPPFKVLSTWPPNERDPGPW
ncbi:MAG: hypothetical protein ABI983_10395 [Acidobacteriota bacterium]